MFFWVKQKKNQITYFILDIDVSYYVFIFIGTKINYKILFNLIKIYI